MTALDEMLKRKQVLKDKDGNVLPMDPQIPPLIFLAKGRCKGHDLRWGPLCRVMKRKPKGKEWVSVICKTCGTYVEWVLRDEK